MKQRILLSLLVSLLSTKALLAQISNTETTITLTSLVNLHFHPLRVCPSLDYMPASSPSNIYQMYVEFEDGDNWGAPARLPASGYYNCTVVKTATATGPLISINVPAATFPTINNTSFMWGFMETRGRVYLINTSTSTTYVQNWEFDQFYCPW